MALNELPLGHTAEFFFSTVPIDILSGIVVWLPMSSGGQIERDDFMPTDPLPKLTCLEAENCSELIMGDRTKGIRSRGTGGAGFPAVCLHLKYTILGSSASPLQKK